ncbi:MAG TPA: type II toxin-antitoxin system prevent-host-death family antitoxin [Candidatus Binatia bacterium]|nr:type II toxin-antitoxin system prevent-host-death family antitoxin [Candidatus Binatia bacterium]
MVNIHQAKTQLSKLVDEAAAGREIVIAKAGKPTAKLVPLNHGRKNRKLGILKGKLRARKNFDAPLPDDVAAAFEG